MYLHLEVKHYLYVSLVCGLFICIVDSVLTSHLAHISFVFTLSAAGPPSPAEHLREVFYRMGLNDKVFTECSVSTKLT
jgi:hypothetical protein